MCNRTRLSGSLLWVLSAGNIWKCFHVVIKPSLPRGRHQYARLIWDLLSKPGVVFPPLLMKGWKHPLKELNIQLHSLDSKAAVLVFNSDIKGAFCWGSAESSVTAHPLWKHRQKDWYAPAQVPWQKRKQTLTAYSGVQTLNHEHFKNT